MAAILRKTSEAGEVLSKSFRPASDAWRTKDGKDMPAQPDRYYVMAISGEELDEVTGYASPVVLEYQVTKEDFDVYKFKDRVIVTYLLGGQLPKAYGIERVGDPPKEKQGKISV